MDAVAQLALMAKAKLVFESPGTFLSFPALSPLNYTPDQLRFTQAATPQDLLLFSDFARLTNALPQGALFQPSLDTELWDIYQQALESMQLAHGVLTAQQSAALKAAETLLYTTDASGVQSDSPTLTAYKQYRQAWLTATINYKTGQLTAALSTDPNVRAQWQNMGEPQARTAVQSAESDWENKGFKAQVEQAQQVEASLSALSPQLKWQAWSSACNPLLDFITDPNNQSFAPTVFAPFDLAEHSGWPSFTISGAEIPQLLNQAPAELKNIFGTLPSGSTIDSVSFEYSTATLSRPWFHPEVFEARFWRFADGTQLSDGNTPPQGKWPAYITGLIFARNIVVSEHATAAPAGAPPVRSFPPVLLHLAQTSQPLRLQPVATPHPVLRPAAMMAVAGSNAPMTVARAPGPAPTPAAPVIRPQIMLRLNQATFAHLPAANQATAPAPAGPSVAPPPPPPPPQTVSILAFVCRRLPKCPNPDPSLSW